MSLFFIRWQFMFGAMLGIGGVFLLYIFVRSVPLLYSFANVSVKHNVRM